VSEEAVWRVTRRIRVSIATRRPICVKIDLSPFLRGDLPQLGGIPDRRDWLARNLVWRFDRLDRAVNTALAVAAAGAWPAPSGLSCKVGEGWRVIKRCSAMEPRGGIGRLAVYGRS
jgi:hypothetical protein